MDLHILAKNVRCMRLFKMVCLIMFSMKFCGVRMEQAFLWNTLALQCRDENRALIGAVVTFRDVTKQRKDDEMFRLVVEAAPSGMVMIDREGTIVLANVLICEQFGYCAGAIS